MANRFVGRGNLGAEPSLRHVDVAGEKRVVCSLRVYFDRQVPDGDGGFEDRGGFWLDVSQWGKRGESAAKILTKGARVAVTGVLTEHAWIDKESGEERSRLEVVADHVDLDLARVAGITWRPKAVKEAAGELPLEAAR